MQLGPCTDLYALPSTRAHMQLLRHPRLAMCLQFQKRSEPNIYSSQQIQMQKGSHAAHMWRATAWTQVWTTLARQQVQFTIHQLAP